MFLNSLHFNGQLQRFCLQNQKIKPTNGSTVKYAMIWHW